LAVVGRDDGQWEEIAARHRVLLQTGSLRFLGALYGPERFHAYADADLFALTPRHWEETSVAALEAGASGTGLVLTEQSDIPGLVESGGGLVVPCQVEAVRAALRSALPRTAELGDRAREHVRAQHGREAVVAQLERTLAAVAAA
jgi:glycosyltransferase involved in cell wall biosynthesis